MGMDISKNTLDCHLYVQQKSLAPVSNDLKGFKAIKKWLTKELKCKTEGLLVVMEYTGIYTYSIERFLNQQGISYVKRPALDIKRSLGMVRGKSDKADARFISKYGWMRKDQLMSHRDKLVADKSSYQCKLKELSSQMGKKLNETMAASMEYIMDVLTQEIKEAEKEIKELLKADESLQTNYQLMCSITGIGFASAVHLLIATENFTRFTDVRKLICYCGVAPFEHSSGTSIRGKVRVSQLANKKLKSLSKA